MEEIKSICFIGQFPPPLHGLSKAIETLYNSTIIDEYNVEKINITDNRKFIGNIIRIIKCKSDLFYFTISQTKKGNLRDLIILKTLQIKHKKCLIHLHGGYYRKLIDNDLNKWQRKANYNAINKLNGVIVLGKSLKSIFQGMIDEKKIFVVENCVDDNYLMDDYQFERKINIMKKENINNILYLSNFITSKGYREVLKIAKLEKERVENGGKRKLHFNFAGKFFENSEKKYFFSYIKDNNLEDYVTYHGIVSGEKKRHLLMTNDIFILLTSYQKEGQPISILEAMGNGMMIVTTQHAGIPDIVNENNGIIVQNNENFCDVYNKILFYIEQDIKQYKLYNRMECKKLYSQENYIINMKKVFSKILENNVE